MDSQKAFAKSPCRAARDKDPPPRRRKGIPPTKEPGRTQFAPTGQVAPPAPATTTGFKSKPKFNYAAIEPAAFLLFNVHQDLQVTT
jgi:hypothetical protein